MIDLILDTNIWINYIAQDNPSGIFEKIKNFIDNGEINLLSNEIIIEEWRRNKEKTVRNISNEIKALAKNIKDFKEFIPDSEISNFKDVVNHYKSSEEKRLELAQIRYKEIEKLLTDSDQTPITNEMKLKVVDWALEKRAPFTVKGNSVGDALILLSAAEFRIKSNRTSPNGFFVTFNHTDYASKDDKDEIHQDLTNLLEKSNLMYKREIGEVMHLAEELLIEIENWIDMQTEFEKERRRGM